MEKTIKLNVTYKFKGLVFEQDYVITEGVDLMALLPKGCQIINIYYFNSL